MFTNGEKRVRQSTVAMVFCAGTLAAQDLPLPTPQNVLGRFGSRSSISTAAITVSTDGQKIDVPAGNLAPATEGRRRITLEQVKQQSFVNPTASPLGNLAQLSIEAAKQHRLGAQADYFPR